MSLSNIEIATDQSYTSHVPKNESDERVRIISSATVKAIKHEKNESKVDPESSRSPSVGSFQTTYKAHIPEIPKHVRLAYRRDVASFHALQEWEGYVTDISEEEFGAELVDLTNTEMPTQEKAVFDKSELSEDSLSLLEEGAVFRWSIGYETLPGGTKRRVSLIIFRRMPAWKKSDLEQAAEHAKAIKDNIRWD